MDPQIACSLSPAQLANRKDDLAMFASDALRAREPLPGGERLTFAAGADTEAGLRAIIAAEAECCAFLRFDLHGDGDVLRLDVTGPDDAQPIIAGMFA